MADLLLPAGINNLAYLGTSALALTGSGKPTWLTTPNVNGISKPSTNRLGFITLVPGSNFPPFTTLDPATPGQPLNAYLLNLKVATTVDAALFTVLPQVLTSLSGPAGETMTEFSDQFCLSVAALPTASFSLGTGTVEENSSGSWVTLGAILPANTWFKLRVQHPNNAAFTATLTLTY